MKYFTIFYIILFWLIYSFSSLNAQEKFKRYFVLDFQIPSDTESNLFRIYVIDENKTSFKDYIDSTLLRQGKIFGSKNLDEIDKFIFYSKNYGKKFYYEDFFNKMKIELVTYNNFGKKNQRIFVQNKDYKVGDAWSMDGESVLKNGTGIQTIRYENNNLFNEFKDSILVNSYIIREDKNDTIYNLFDKMAEPKEGMDVFYNKIRENLKLPKKYNGNTYVAKIRFTINEQGKLEDILSLRKKYDPIDDYIIKYFKSVPKWDPAIFHDKPVKTRFDLPIKLIL